MAAVRPGVFYQGMLSLVWLLAVGPFTPQAGSSHHALVEGSNVTPPVAPSTVSSTSGGGRRGQTPGVSSRAATLPSPVTDVAKLCVCNLLVAQCDVNCCCDPDCSAEDFSVFSTCSVPLVRGASELCSQEVAIYSLNTTAVPPRRVFSLVNQVNPNIFCIYSINYRPGLSFISPVIPTESNFDGLVKEFSGNSFSTAPDASAGASNPARYEYGAPIQTKDSFLRFPVPLVSSQCTDNNPAGFLVNQDVTCSRSINVENCNIPALSTTFYASEPIVQVPNSNNMINITVQNLNGILDLNSSNGIPNTSQVCRNVVLGQNRTPVPVSGNPGYVVGLPLVAGFHPFASGITQSTNRYGQFTVLKSYSNQDCLAIEGNRTPVIFGYNTVSGCKIRYSPDSTCLVIAEAIKNVLMGQNFPEYVASFGNSQTRNVLDWVPITFLNTTGKDACQIPLSLDIDVKWIKYGSLVNPQAKIINVTAQLTYKSLQAGTAQTVQVLSSVTFTDASAPAQPGYKAQPTINAKLPFDFFYPFV
ncbi:tectonic-1 isoform X2 [Microcaecilia unicolor]|uniref:Tectonic-1 isoform X2 n=1 Tax=Microcaecilia unicolor TaxID=1415580 RepID=A0A6P7Z9D1_9AMPH|nr:tectonic-1 isoform X2 [Microcaecilia unicolor]